MNFFEKSRNKLVHLLFPLVERVYPFLSLVLILAIWLIPEACWRIRVVSFGLWLLSSEVHWAGAMERDCLPIQPGGGIFYHIYRFIDGTLFLFWFIFLVIMLIPGPRWLGDGLCGVLIIAVSLRAVGERKYRPKKPEES